MARVDLVVPFSEKDEAKSLGARWDPRAKTWYVPEDKVIGPFARWLPLPENSDVQHWPEFHLRSPYYFQVESESECWKCGVITRVFSFMLPEVHEQFTYLEEDEEGFTETRNLGYWKSPEYRGIISSINGLAPQVHKQIRARTEHYKPAYSKTAGETYFMNHCEHCEAKLGDFFMHSEPGGAFFPTSPNHASKMTLKKINERFDGNGGVSYAADDFMEYVKILPFGKPE